MAACSTAAEKLTVIGWNVESGDADPRVLAKTIADIDGCDVWGFSEVHDRGWANIFEKAAEVGEDADFEVIFGASGGGDRLAIVYDKDRLECVSTSELKHINIMGRVRAPLIARFRDRPSGVEFIFMVNHLYRGRANARHKQAEMLNAWLKRQELPVIMVGDYNFDWDVPSGRHDVGYDRMTAGGVCTWLKPETISRTHCDTKYNSVLDFVFVAGKAADWSGASRILFTEDATYCPDDATTSDHYPIEAVFVLPQSDPAAEIEPDSVGTAADEDAPTTQPSP